MLENIAEYWQKIQGSLFPFLEEQLPHLTEKQQQLVEILEVVKIERFIDPFYCPIGARGRPRTSRSALARAFIAKAVYNMSTTEALLDRLHSDSSLRRICGWEYKSEIPTSSSFSRAFAEFAESGLPQRVHKALIETAYRKKNCGPYLS